MKTRNSHLINSIPIQQQVAHSLLLSIPETLHSMPSWLSERNTSSSCLIWHHTPRLCSCVVDIFFHHTLGFQLPYSVSSHGCPSWLLWLNTYKAYLTPIWDDFLILLNVWPSTQAVSTCRLHPHLTLCSGILCGSTSSHDTLFILSGFYNNYNQIHPSLLPGSESHPSGFHVVSYQSSMFPLTCFGFHLIDTRANCSGKEKGRKRKESKLFTLRYGSWSTMSCWALTQTYGLEKHMRLLISYS